MKIGVITAPRSDGSEYLRFTLGQLLTKDTCQEHEIRVFVDALELPAERVEHERVTYELASAPHLARVAKGGVHGTLNFCRALRWSAEGQGLACVLEDDVELAKDWAMKAQSLCVLASRMSKGYVLSLHHFYQLGDFRVCVGANQVQLLRWRDANLFYGGQGLMMPAECGSTMAEKLDQSMDLPREERAMLAMDMGVKTVVMTHNWGLYATNPCLLQHVGDVSCWTTERPPIRNAFFRG